jgi:hypothetical protein
MTGLDHDRRDPWAPYGPTPGSPWDLRRVVHLHRRAGFAAAVDVLRGCEKFVIRTLVLMNTIDVTGDSNES